MTVGQSPRYIGPKVETRLPQPVIDWIDKVCPNEEMTRAEYIREVILEHYDQNKGL